MIEKIHVNLNLNSYNIYIGNQLLDDISISSVFLNHKNSVIVTNETIYNILLKNKANSNFYNYIKDIKFFLIQDGEYYKNFKTVESIISFLLNQQYGRDLSLIALGGGVVGDITGFVASIYQRGINFFQIPTTLLAQVDASIGGKTGINHALGKNMIGSFWQPKGVLIDINFLSTLPKKHFISGIAEIIKYAIIFDNNFFMWLEKNLLKILQLEENKLLFCIKKCCELKASIIENDEKENGSRAFLNLGHSFAHAIETYSGYGKWLHGNAVSVGIVMASYLSFQLGILKKDDLFKIINIFYNIGLPIKGPKHMKPNDYLILMSRDKKVLNGIMRFILPISIGKVKIFSSIDKNILLNAIKKFQKKIYFFNS
ncbi:3-dehydroquinate synthase [Buchnera aphidicola (Cinara piceae)]|uniref:3-dehydroquinate synthase n=1 Tax=Buchnera aphidicola (Cinara piceae) TaxID=1660043 RepID=A0A803FUD6_9GAMM|nr:3-dehydroquinate synthase [Buchnera aphidicola]VFP88759.1 3-dehydroquinate synthase [Buchnera aphidicola (Cinara piceae)]